MIEIICIISLILNLISFFILIFLGAFLVRFQERMNGILKDLFSVLNSPFLSQTQVPSFDAQQEPETWDEKYEKELEAIQRRLRADTGLVSLPDPGLSWGQPPAPNPSNMKDLNVKDN